LIKSRIDTLAHKNLLLLVVVIQLAVCFLIFSNVSVARQVTIFFYLTFLPGVLILTLLNLNKFDHVERLLYSTGLSIAFMMILGLILNYFGPFFGLSEPLSILPVTVTINVSVALLTLLICFAHKKWESLDGHIIFQPAILIPVALLTVSVAGALLVSFYGNNLVSLFMIATVAIMCILNIVALKEIPSKLYVISILSISISLLLNATMISNYIHGPDIQLEYYLFRLTQTKGLWDPSILFFDTGYARSNAMLSVTVLPTIYSNMLSIDATWIYKIIFPLIYAFTPLGIYKLSKIHFGDKIGYISAFLFMSELTFVLIAGLAREMIGELFFVLLLLVLFNKSASSTARFALFGIFSFALVTSHYSMALVFLFFIFSAWVLLQVQKKRSAYIRLDLILLFASIMFLWYIYIYWSTPFNSILEFARYTYSGLNEFLNPASRGSEVLRGIGLEQAPTIWQWLSRGFAYLIQFFTAIGAVFLLVRKAKRKTEYEYTLFVALAGLLLALCILLPRFALSLNMSRFYHISLFVLAPIFAIGCEVLASFFMKYSKQLFTMFVLVTLISYFLFQSGFVYEVVKNESWTVPLSMYRMGIRPYTIEFCYVREQDVFGSAWLSNTVDRQTTSVYADMSSVFNVLASYGMFYRDIGGRIEVLSNVTVIKPDGKVFLSTNNVLSNFIEGEKSSWNSSMLQPLLEDLSKAYTNGASEVYTKP